MPIAKQPAAAYPVKSAEQVIPVVLSAPVVIFADTETTGFGVYDDITEIGAVKVDTETGKVLERFSSFCHLRQRKTVPQKIVDLTGITTEMLADAPSIEQVLRAFYTFIGSTPLSFHNATFDWRMLGIKYDQLGIRLSNEVICTMKLFKYLHPECPSANLDAITTYYGRPIEGHHRAYVDSKWAAACYCKMKQELKLRMGPANDQIHFLEPNTCQLARKELSYEELQRTCVVHRVCGWKKGQRIRIYCTTNLADFFYDLNEHVWNVSQNKTDMNLNVNQLAQFILAKLGLPLGEFISRYQPA